MPGVSVVIPCYKYGRHLAACVESVLSQPGVRPSILIIDDCSPDDSWSDAVALADAHPEVEAWRHHTNVGHIGTYNQGLAWAREKYVLLLSADDLLTPGALARAIAPMEADDRIGLVYGQPLEFVDGQPLPEPEGTHRGHTVWRGDRWLARRCRDTYNVVPTPTAVLRTSVQHRVGGYQPELPHAGDFEMWLRVAAVADLAYVRGVPQAYYRVHDASMSQGVYRERLADVRERREVFDRFFAEHPDALQRAGIDRQDTARALAREPLWWACRSYELGNVAQDPIQDWLDFAASCVDDLDSVWTHRALRRRRLVGEAIARRTHVFAATGALKRAQQILWRRQWMRNGG